MTNFVFQNGRGGTRAFPNKGKGQIKRKKFARVSLLLLRRYTSLAPNGPCKRKSKKTAYGGIFFLFLRAMCVRAGKEGERSTVNFRDKDRE